uniref:Carbonic anhydrase n=1 Tax=Cacopsylla melanoneura TaxID=428564 RepID=A0A8D9BM24_9HEMI
MKNLIELFSFFVAILSVPSASAFGFGHYRLSRRQAGGLGSVVFPGDYTPGQTTRSALRKVATKLPESVQNFLGIDQDDLDYFEVGPIDDRFPQRPREDKCKTGRQQSPINIDSSDTEWKEYPRLDMNGHWNFKHKVLLFNEGHTVMLKEKGGSNRPKISGGPLRESYTFEQLHFHWGPDASRGSEHTINGQRFSAEAHMVHYQSRYGSYKKAKENNGLLVLGYLFQVSERENEEIADFIDPIPLIARFKNVSFSSPDILKIFKKASNACYYTYEGSLTTGDCAEGVLWILFNQTIPISSYQLNQFRKMYGSNGELIRSNYREVQRINGRSVEFVTTDSSKRHGDHSPRRGRNKPFSEDYEFTNSNSRPVTPRYGRY